MNHRERFVRVLTGQKVDRVPFIKLFGGTNSIRPAWEQQVPGLSKSIDRILGFEGVFRGWGVAEVNLGLAQVGPAVVLEDNAARCVRRYPHGAVEIIQKGCDFHAQTIEWPVKNQADWQRLKAKHLQADDPARFPANWPSRVAEYRQRDYPLQLTHGGVYGFARNLMGDENLLYAFYDAPGLVHDIMDSYTEMVITIWERMAREVEFDLIEFWEDMASKNGCLISPEMFREFMRPNYLRVAAFAKAHGIRIILVDSDGYTDQMVSFMQAAGVTAMYPFEAGAGCRVEAVRKSHPEFGMLGGLAKECMIAGKAAIDREIAKVRRYIQLGRFIPGPDHFVQSDVTWDNYRYFMEQLKETIMTTTPGSEEPGA
jgi:uroporphyrinogen decarboxylase